MDIFYFYSTCLLRFFKLVSWPVSINEGLSSCGALVTSEHFEGGGLPRSIHSQQAETLSRPDAQTQAVYGQDATHLPGFIHLRRKTCRFTSSPADLSKRVKKQYSTNWEMSEWKKGLKCRITRQRSLRSTVALMEEQSCVKLCENLSQVLDLQHVVVSVSSQNSASLTGHVHIVIFYRLAADRYPPGHTHTHNFPSTSESVFSRCSWQHFPI